MLAVKTRESRPVVTAEIAWQPASPQMPDVIANPPTSRRTSGGQANGGQVVSVPLGEEDLRMVSVFRTLANAVIGANATPVRDFAGLCECAIPRQYLVVIIRSHYDF